MGWATPHIDKLRRGETVQFRPRGNSMMPGLLAQHPDYRIEYEETADPSWKRYTGCSRPVSFPLSGGQSS